MRFTNRWSRESNPLNTEISDGCKKRPEISEKSRTPKGTREKEEGREARARSQEERSEEVAAKTKSGQASGCSQEDGREKKIACEEIICAQVRAEESCSQSSR
jgi:hypothetical protein